MIWEKNLGARPGPKNYAHIHIHTHAIIYILGLHVIVSDFGGDGESEGRRCRQGAVKKMRMQFV